MNIPAGMGPVGVSSMNAAVIAQVALLALLALPSSGWALRVDALDFPGGKVYSSFSK
jgi:hypothetical protein